MDLREACEKLSADYNAILNRFGGMDSLYIKFLKKFLEDKTYDELQEAWKEQDYSKIETSAHTLKGVAGNLGLERLYTASNNIVQQLRQHEYENLENSYEEIVKEYEFAKEIITSID